MMKYLNMYNLIYANKKERKWKFYYMYIIFETKTRRHWRRGIISSTELSGLVSWSLLFLP
jgi:hypothetical protein